jgi:uncharacterized sodium:solute symporter family permease YidK
MRRKKCNVIGSADSVLPFGVLFTGLIINQLYLWSMNQTIIQRVLGTKNLVEAQNLLLLAGALKILMPLDIILPGVVGYYHFECFVAILSYVDRTINVVLKLIFDHLKLKLTVVSNQNFEFTIVYFFFFF